MKIKNKKANAIVNLILADLKDRCGLGDAWDEIDRGIKQEITDEWVKIVAEEIEEIEEIEET